ncbi:MAG: DUF4012 domain-containing protein, partial [Methanobacteriaceae archaeon]
EKNVLVLAVDESEKRSGMGAVDMAFIVNMENGEIKKSTPFYPGGQRHPTVSEPPEAGSGKLLLHDSLWYSDNTQGMQWAKEIVESKTNQKIDAVVAIDTKGLDSIIDASKPISIKGQTINISGIDLVREEQDSGGMSRGDAVLALSAALIKASNDPSKKIQMGQAIMAQYTTGNILVDPSGSFFGFIVAKLI